MPEHPELPPFLAAPARGRPEDPQGLNQPDDTKEDQPSSWAKSTEETEKYR